MTKTPTYAVTLRAPGWRMTPMAWDTKRHGRPTDERLAAYVEGFEAATRPGGVNEHLGVMVCSSAKVVRQSTGETVATYQAPAFQVVS